MTDQPDVSATLIRSFFAVMSGIIIATFGYFITVALVIVIFFPVTRDKMFGAGNNVGNQVDDKQQVAQEEQNKEPGAKANEEAAEKTGEKPGDEKLEDAGKQRVAPAPKAIDIPDKVFYFCPFLLAVMAFLGGYVAARYAPTSPIGHGSLVAGFLLLTAMNMLLSDDAMQPQWLSALNVVLGPGCAFWGATIASRRFEIESEDDFEEPEE